MERRVSIPHSLGSRSYLTPNAVLQRVAGKDASKQFWKYHNEGILKKYKGQLQVGSLDTKPKAAAPPTPPASPKEVVKPSTAGPAAPSPGPGAQEAAEAMEPFGDLIPFADPSWYQSVSFTIHSYSWSQSNAPPASFAIFQRKPRSPPS